MNTDQAQTEQDKQQDPTSNFEVVTNEGAALPEPVVEQEPKTEPEASNEPASESTNADQERGSNRFQKRIDRLTKRAAEAERLASEERQKREELEKKLTGDKPGATNEPDPANFDNYSDYLDALSKFNDIEGDQDKKTEQQKAPEQKEQADADFDDALAEVQASFADSASKYADFNEVVTAPDVPITPDMVKALAEVEDPAALAYYLGKNKAEAARIAGLKPLAIAREFGLIEAKLSKQPTKNVTKAPDPITPVSGSDGSAPALRDLSFSDYEREMNKRERRNGFW